MAKKKKKVVKKIQKKVIKKKSVKKKITKKVKPKKITKPVTKSKVNYANAISPLGERLVVRLVQREQVTAGGIIIPNTVETKIGYLKGDVLAVGPGSKTKKGQSRPLDVQVGDTVLFQGYASIKVEFNAEELHIVNESDVLGIV